MEQQTEQNSISCFNKRHFWEPFINHVIFCVLRELPVLCYDFVDHSLQVSLRLEGWRGHDIARASWDMFEKPSQGPGTWTVVLETALTQSQPAVSVNGLPAKLQLCWFALEWLSKQDNQVLSSKLTDRLTTKLKVQRKITSAKSQSFQLLIKNPIHICTHCLPY